MRPSLIGRPGSAECVASCDGSTTGGKPVDKYRMFHSGPTYCAFFIKGAVSWNSAKLRNHKIPFKLRET